MDNTSQNDLQYFYDRLEKVLASKTELRLLYNALNDGKASTGFVESLITEISNKAPLNSPTFTGTPTAPTATAGTNSQQLATTAFVSTAIANLVNSAPAELDTLKELADALGDDANFATTVTNALAGKLAANSADYLKALSINGTTLTYTLGDNTTGTLTTQDTTYDTMTAQEATTGTDTTGKLIPPKILNDKIEEKIPTNISAFTNDSGYLTADDVDNELDSESANPVENQVITAALEKKEDLIFSEPVSGSFITLEDCEEGLPLHNVIVDINPIQDLHGYDYPWVGGAGKNLLPNKETATINQVTFTLESDGGYTLSGTATNGNGAFDIGRDVFSLPAGTYTLTMRGNSNAECSLFKIVEGTATYVQGGNSTFVIAETTSLFVRLLISSGTAASGTAYVQIEKGTTSTTYEPYSNICPITGYDSVNVYRSGKNLLESPIFNNNYCQWATGPTNKTNMVAELNQLPIGDYIISATLELTERNDATDASTCGIILFYGTPYIGKNNIPWGSASVGDTINIQIPISITAARAGNFTNILFYGCGIGTGGIGVTGKATVSNLQLELGSEATAYEPYGDTYTSTLPSTVYSGKLNVTTGELVVDKKYCEVTSFYLRTAYPAGDSYLFSARGFGDAISNKTPFANSESITNKFVWDTTILNTDKTGFYIGYEELYARIKGVSTLNEFMQDIGNSLTVVYPLAEPITYHLTPQQITTLLGTNNIWSNGESITVDYWQQPAIKEYVDKKVKTPYIYPVKGTQVYNSSTNTKTGAWTGNIDVDQLYDGLTIAYYLPMPGDGNATLNLTLSDGTQTGPVNVYYSGASRMTTHYGAGSTILLTYWSAGSIIVSGNVTTNNRWTHGDYTISGSSVLFTNGAHLKAKTNLYRYQICLTYDENYILPINAVDNSTATTKTLTTESFNPFGTIYYHNSTNNTNINDRVPSQRLYLAGSPDLRYSFNTGSTLTAGQAVYLVAALQSDGKAKLHSTPITQSLPAIQDGLIYIYLGHAMNTSAIYFEPTHPIYQYKNGKIQLFTQDAATVNGHTIESNVPANATFDYYGNCANTSGNVAKTATIPGFVLKDGAIVKIHFDNRNNATEPTLNINNTGAKPIWSLEAVEDQSTSTYNYEFSVLKKGDWGLLGPTNPYVTFMYDANLGTNGVYKLIESPNLPTIFPRASIGNSYDFNATVFYPIMTNASTANTNTGIFTTPQVRISSTSGHAAIEEQGIEGQEGYVAPQAAQEGLDAIILGNATAYPNENNSKGTLTLYTKGTTYSRIRPQDNLGSSSTYYLPEVVSTGSTANPFQVLTVAEKDTSTGDATNPVYVNSDGQIQACTYALNADVPSGAVFTDTTYSEATTSAAGLMSALDKDKLDTIDLTAITKLQQVLTKESNQTNSLTWAVGSFTNANGTNYSSTARIRTTDFLKCSQYTRISVDAGYKFSIWVYSTNATSGYLGRYDGESLITSNTWMTDPIWINFNNNYYIRIVLSQVAEGTMTTDEKAHIQIYGFN